MSARTSTPRRTFDRLLGTALIALSIALLVPGTAAAAPCVTSPNGSSYSVTVCFTSPAAGASLTGNATVTGTITVSPSGAASAARLVFTQTNSGINADYLLTDFQSPYTFTLPTTKWVDGTKTLGVSAVMRDGFATASTDMSVTFNNGITSPPVNNNQFTPRTGTTPAPGQPLLVAAVGDGAGGETGATTVTNMIAGWNPNLLLYLGDVYEKGSAAEFYNWYGSGTQWYSRFNPITDPSIGNHEYEAGPNNGPSQAKGYFDYWDNVPSYYSYNSGGWHFISLNSTSQFGQTSTSSPQYQWLQADLQANTSECVLAYWHHPVLSEGPQGNATRMNAIWSLLASKGADLVVTGHDHNYQRWQPLDANLQPSPTGTTEIVAGTGGHGTQAQSTTDSRAVLFLNTQGALQLSLTNTQANFKFFDSTGAVRDSGTVPCANSADTTPPSPAPTLTATAINPTRIDLSWTASGDNVGVTGYAIYKDGSPTPLTTVNGTTRTYSDTSVTGGTTHSYVVKAFDAANNFSQPSNTATATTPVPDTTAPNPPPSNLSATAVSANRIDLSWTGSSDNVGVTGYGIYRNGGTTPIATVNGTTTSYSDTTVAPLTTYTYQVDAFDAANNHSAKSNTASATTSGTRTFTPTDDTYIGSSSATSTHGTSRTILADGSPVTYSLLKFDLSTLPAGTVTQATLRVYTSSKSNVGHTVRAMSSNNWSEGTATWNSASALVGGTSVGSSGPITSTGYTSVNVTSLVSGAGVVSMAVATSDTSSITYSSKEGNNAPQLLVTMTAAGSDTQPPNAPVLTLGTVSGHQVDLSWTKPDDNGGGVVAGYKVYRNGNATPIATINSGNTLTYSDTGLADAQTYTYTVKAFDGSNNLSVDSNQVSATTPDVTAPQAPVLQASAVSTSEIDLSWNKPTDNVATTGYQVFRDGGANPIATINNGNTLTYQDTGLAPASTHSYTVKAVDAANNLSGPSNTASATTQTVPDLLAPDPPVLSLGTVGGHQVDLSWTKPNDNGGGVVSGYKVYRDGNATPITTINNGNTLTYSDTGLNDFQTYTYTVKAFDGSNNLSQDSNQVSATTPDVTAPQAPVLGASAVSTSEIDLSWNQPNDNAGVTGYRIFRDGSSTPLVTINAGTTTAYADTGLAPGSTHTYTVKAFDAANNTSVASNQVSATTQGGGSSSTVTLTPVADAYVDSSQTGVNFGTNGQIRVDGSPIVRGYLRFDLSAVPGTITGATLRVFATSGSSAGHTVYSVANTTWDERTITWDTAPAIGATSVGGSGAITANTWTAVDVSSLVTGKTPLSMSMVGTNATAIAYVSKDSTTLPANKPQLVVTYTS